MPKGRKSKVKIDLETVKNYLQEHCDRHHRSKKPSKIAEALGYPPPTYSNGSVITGNVLKYYPERRAQFNTFQSALRQVNKHLKVGLEEGWAKTTWIGGKGHAFRFCTEEEKIAEANDAEKLEKYKQVVKNCGINLNVSSYGLHIPFEDLEILVPYLTIFAAAKKAKKEKETS